MHVSPFPGAGQEQSGERKGAAIKLGKWQRRIAEPSGGLLWRQVKSTKPKVAKVAETNAEFFLSHPSIFSAFFLHELCISALRCINIPRGNGLDEHDSQQLFCLLMVDGFDETHCDWRFDESLGDGGRGKEL